MSWMDATPGETGDRVPSAVDMVIVPRARDLGGFEVRRALPSAKRTMVGPFIFWDQMGPAEFPPGEGLDVRPHPHIGLATVTYVLDGEILHRDSLGTVRPIAHGALNVMTAGRGIVHSERTAPEQRADGPRLFGIQAWVALPKAHEEDAPAFRHHGAEELPVIEHGGTRVRLLAGELLGQRSPVALPMALLYAEVVLAPGASLPLDDVADERALYVTEGEVEIAGKTFPAGQLLVLRPGDRLAVRTARGATAMLLGGDAADGPRHLWWNFVHSDPERIRAAAADWRRGAFDGVPHEHEFIPLPDHGPEVYYP